MLEVGKESEKEREVVWSCGKADLTATRMNSRLTHVVSFMTSLLLGHSHGGFGGLNPSPLAEQK